MPEITVKNMFKLWAKDGNYKERIMKRIEKKFNISNSHNIEPEIDHKSYTLFACT